MAYGSGDPEFDRFINTGDVRALRRSLKGWIASKTDAEQERIRAIVKGPDAMTANTIDENSPEAQVNRAYWERNQLVAYLSKCYPIYLGIDPDEPDWPVVYIETPAGQLSWHVNKGEAAFYFDHLRKDIAMQWDGHTSEEKYERLAKLP